MKIMKIKEFLVRTMTNHENLRISCENHETYENLRIPREHYENHANLKIQRENYENHEAYNSTR